MNWTPTLEGASRTDLAHSCGFGKILDWYHCTFLHYSCTSSVVAFSYSQSNTKFASKEKPSRITAPHGNWFLHALLRVGVHSRLQLLRSELRCARTSTCTRSGQLYSLWKCLPTCATLSHRRRASNAQMTVLVPLTSSIQCYSVSGGHLTNAR